MADGYQITSQRQSSSIDGTGAMRDVMVIGFQTPDGSQGSVRVPLEEYNAATVAAMVSARAAAMAEIAGL